MDMKANFKSKDQKRYLLVTFGCGNVALYSKDNVHVDAYESWQKASDIAIEELSPRDITDRLTGENWPRLRRKHTWR